MTALEASPPGTGALATAPVPGGRWTEASLMLMVVIWGVNFTVVKWALEVFSPLGFNALRYLLACLCVYAIMRARGPLRLPERRDVPRIVALGVIGNVIYQFAFVFGLDRTRAGNASLMLALVPVFIALLSVWRGHEPGNAAVWSGALLSVIGVSLVSGSTLRLEGTATLVGDLMLLGASLVWALYTVGAQSMIRRYGSLPVTAWTLWVGGVAIVLAGVPALLAQDWGIVSRAAWGGVVYSAVLSIALAYLIWYRGVERLGSTRTAIFANLTPVVALVTGAVWLGERLTPLSLAGALLALLGIVLVRAATTST